MKLLRFDVDGVLGLRGSIDFTNAPVLMYGKNIAGKSNIVNLIRYLLIKPRRGGKRYSEDLRLKKEELIFDREEGRCNLYLSAGQRLYRISLLARKGRKVNISYSISSSSKTVSPEKLSDVKWIEEKRGKGEKIWDDLKELKFYPDLLEVLISPSNVKNFAEAISGELVSVPEMIKEELNRIHTGTKNYLDTLTGLDIVLSRENDRISKAVSGLREEFSNLVSKIDIDPSVFDRGARTLETIGQEVSKRRREFIEEKTQLKRGLESPELKMKIEAYQKAREFVKREKEMENCRKGAKEAERKAQELRKFREFLIDIKARRIEDITSVEIPPQTGLSGGAKEIVEGVKNAVHLVVTANEICKKRGINLDDIKRLLPAYRELHKSIKRPLKEVAGARAVVFRNGEKSVVSIPADEVGKNPEVFVELEPLPKVHIGGGKAGASTLKAVERKVKTILSEMKSAEKSLREAGQLLREVRKRGDVLEREAETAEKQAARFDDLLRKLVKGLGEISGSMKIFGVQIAVQEDIENIPHFFKNLGSHLKEIEKVLRKELAGISPEISPDTPVDKVLEKLQKRKEEVDRREIACAGLERWLTQNLAEIARLESKRGTIELLEEASLVCREVLEAIHKRTNIGPIIESISEEVSGEVETALQAILAGSGVEFVHLGGGRFECRMAGEKITHPSGSERACMSIGVMASLAKCFDVPVIFDEALDRIDADNVVSFVNYLTGISRSIQICIVACKSFNIEKNQKLMDSLSNWKIYRISVKGKEKLIEPVNAELIIETLS